MILRKKHHVTTKTIAMKFLNCLIFLFLLTGTLWSQTNEYNFQTGFYSNPSIIKTTASGKIIVGLSYRDDIYIDNYAKLIVMSELGEILWEYDDLAPQGIIRDIILLGDETFYVVGRGDNSCDNGGFGFVYKFDENGNVLLNSSFEDRLLNSVAADTFPNGDLVLLDNHSIQRITASNEEVWEDNFIDNFAIQNFTDIKTVGNDLIVVGEPNDGDCTLTFIDNDDFTPLHDYCYFQTDTFLKITYTNNGTYHFISKTRYYAGQDGYALTGGNIFPEANFIQIEANSDFVYILDSKENKIITYENPENFSSGLLSVLDTLYLNLSPNDVPVDFTVTPDNKILLLGKERSTHKINTLPFADSLSQSATFIKEYQLNEDNEFLNYDAGVIDILSTNISTFSTVGCSTFECENLVDLEYTDLKVIIFNYGDQPINSVNLNTRYLGCDDCSGICHSSQTYTRFYDNLNLEPQQSLTLSLDDLLIKQQNADDELELCFWTSVPENKTDKNQENDLFCKLSNLVVANQEIIDAPINLIFIPNTNEIKIEHLNQEGANGILEIFDMLGRKIVSRKIATNDVSFSLPFEYQLNLYIMVYKEQGSTYTRKFINN